MKRDYILFPLLSFLIIAVSCERKWHNPYDDDCPPEIWTPINLTAEETNDGIVLKWELEEGHFDGYQLEITTDSITWNIVNDQLLISKQKKITDTLNYSGETIQYRIRGIADKNQSDYCYSNKLIIEKVILSCEDVKTFTDSRDGNKYREVQIGEQVWMAENLAYLPEVSPSSNGSFSNPYYYVYGYQGKDVNAAKVTDNYQIYGVLYNWSAAVNVCPSGWHLPSDEEWMRLEIYLGMSQSDANKRGRTRGTNEGIKLKATSGWNMDGNGTNEVCFSALPGGSRGTTDSGSNFFSFDYGYWWTATEGSTSTAWNRCLYDNTSSIYKFNSNKDVGRSVRCIRD